MTALHLGAAQGSEKIVRLLLSKNADLNAPDTVLLLLLFLLFIIIIII